MKVCMYVCMCMYVCLCVCPAGRRTHTSHQPRIWRGLLISPGCSTEPEGDPKSWPPGVPPILTPSEIPWWVKNWVGASTQKLLFGVGLPGKILFVGGPPLPQACRVHSTKWGLMHWELRGGQQTKAAPRGGFAWYIFICGGLTSIPGPQGPLHQIGMYALRIGRGLANKSCSSG